MVVPLMQSISGNDDSTYTLYMFPRTTGMLRLPCRPCSGMLCSGCKWSLIRLCTHHVRRVPEALMVVKLTVATSVVYRGDSSHFFGIGITQYQIGSVSVFSVIIVPPFLCRSPLFSSKGGQSSLKRAPCPLLRKKGGKCQLFDTKLYSGLQPKQG